MLKEGGVPSQSSAAPVAAPTMAGEAPAAREAAFPTDFPALVEALDRGGHPNVAATLHDVVRLVRLCAATCWNYQLAGPVHQGFDANLDDALYRMTGQRWEIAETQRRSAAQPVRTGTGSARQPKTAQFWNPHWSKAALEAFPDAMVEVDGRVLNVRRQPKYGVSRHEIYGRND